MKVKRKRQNNINRVLRVVTIFYLNLIVNADKQDNFCLFWSLPSVDDCCISSIPNAFERQHAIKAFMVT